MFELVDRVEQYPEFLPWCSGARVVAERPDGKTAVVQVGRVQDVEAHPATPQVAALLAAAQ